MSSTLDSDGTLGPNDDSAPPTICPGCLELQADTPGAYCDECIAKGQADLLDTSEGADANAAATQAAGDGIASPDAGAEYTGDDFRSAAAFRKEILREVTFRSVEGGDGRTLEGYAAVFNSSADIVDQHGEYRETIQRGAFAKTISERKPVMMFDHGKHPMIGTIPIATIAAITEDAKGLFVRARLADNWLIEPVREALTTGSVKGMSIRATVIKDEWHPNMIDRVVERSISEVALHELGPVVFPAYDETTVSVRSQRVYQELSDPGVQREVARMLLRGVPMAKPVGPRSRPSDGRSKRIAALQRRARLVIAEGA